METIDMWTPPPNVTSKLHSANTPKLSSLFRLLVAVHGPDDSKAQDEEHEWMYELQKLHEGRTPNSLHAVTDAVFAEIHRMPTKCPDFSPLNEDQDVGVNELGYRRLREINYLWDQWKEAREQPDERAGEATANYLSFREFLVELFNVHVGSCLDTMVEGDGNRDENHTT
eukprot:PhM_4_TR2927/c0_g1_i1/m.51166